MARTRLPFGYLINCVGLIRRFFFYLIVFYRNSTARFRGMSQYIFIFICSINEFQFVSRISSVYRQLFLHILVSVWFFFSHFSRIPFLRRRRHFVGINVFIAKFNEHYTPSSCPLDNEFRNGFLTDYFSFFFFFFSLCRK